MVYQASPMIILRPIRKRRRLCLRRRGPVVGEPPEMRWWSPVPIVLTVVKLESSPSLPGKRSKSDGVKGGDIVLQKHGSDDFRDHFNSASTWEQLRSRRITVEWSRVIWFTQGVRPLAGYEGHIIYRYTYTAGNNISHLEREECKTPPAEQSNHWSYASAYWHGSEK